MGRFSQLGSWYSLAVIIQPFVFGWCYVYACPGGLHGQYRGACPASRSDAELQELVKQMGGDEAKIQSALDDWWQSK